MQPFNLDKAKAGEPIIDYLGNTYKFIAHVPEAALHQQVVLVQTRMGDEIHCRFVDGKEHIIVGSDYDLHHPDPKPKEYWVNVYSYEDNDIEDEFYCSDLHHTETEAMKYKDEPNYVKTIKIEI
jgi:hypothetical protein